jgi:hypothetical protein
MEHMLRQMGLGEVITVAQKLASDGTVEKILKFADGVEELNARLAKIEVQNTAILSILQDWPETGTGQFAGEPGDSPQAQAQNEGGDNADPGNGDTGTAPADSGGFGTDLVPGSGSEDDGYIEPSGLHRIRPPAKHRAASRPTVGGNATGDDHANGGAIAGATGGAGFEPAPADPDPPAAHAKPA